MTEGDKEYELTKQQERFIDKKLEEFVECVRVMQEQKEDISTEVMALKSAKAEIIAEIKKALPLLFANLTGALDKVISNRIDGHLQKITTSCSSAITDLEAKITSVRNSLDKELGKHRKIFWSRALTIYGSCLLGAIAMAGAIFYFFPQTNHIHHQISSKDLQTLLVGKAAMAQLSNLDQASKQIILDAYEGECRQHLAQGFAK